MTPQRMDNLVGGKEEEEEKARKTISLFSPPFFLVQWRPKPKGGKGSLFCPPLSSLPLPPPPPRKYDSGGRRREKEAVRKGGGGDISKVLKVWGRRSASGWGRP